MVGLGVWGWAFAGVQARHEGPIASAEETLRAALQDALQGHHWTPSQRITLDVPELAENGAMVPVTVESHLPDTRQLFIFAERNPAPLCARHDFMSGAVPWVSLRLRLNDSGGVLAIARTPEGYFGIRRQVKVMLGGCG